MNRPSPWWYAAGAAVVVGGWAVIMVAAGLTSLVTFLAGVDSMPRVVVPGRADLDLPAGNYTMYSERRSLVDGQTLNAAAVPAMSCRLTDPSGQPITLRASRFSSSYTIGSSYSGESLYVFTAESSGRHELVCENVSQDEPSTALAVHHSGTSLGLVALFGAIGTTAAGVVVCGIVFLLRRRSARTAPVAGTTVSAVSLGAAAGGPDPASPVPQTWPGYPTGYQPGWPASPPPAGPGASPGAPGQRRGAVTALVLSIIGIVAAAIPLALVSLRRGVRGGVRVMAIAAIALSAVWILVAAGVAAVLIPREEGTVLAAETAAASTAPTTQPSPSLSATPTSAVSVDDVREGDCLNRQSATTIRTVPLVPCSSPHDGEVYAIIDVGGGPWPGDDGIQDRAAQHCSQAATGFIGIPAEDSSLDLGWYMPAEEGWNSGDHTVICIISDPAGKVTGTLRGSRR